MILCNQYAGMMIWTRVVSTCAFLYLEPTLAINLIRLGMAEEMTGLGFAVLALAFAIGCLLFGYLSTVVYSTIIVNASMLILGMSIFFIGPSKLMNVPENLSIIFTGLILSGFA